ncbi:hypothetical protein BH11PSE2_BH11PSE2_20480 [soil metagenome]
MKSRFLCGGSVLAVALALMAQPTMAQNQAAKAAPKEDKDAAYAKCLEDAGTSAEAQTKCDDTLGITSVQQVVSTGTLIRGAVENSGTPVEVTNRQSLIDQGNPSMLDFVKSLSETGSVQGENNRGGLAPGTSSINLRQLGSGRTLVLMNGRRLQDSPSESAFTSGNFQDSAQVPTAALQQVEILKEGGSATYGADAVAGVVNFITRRDLNGIEANATYTFMKDAADYDGSILWGKRAEDGGANVLLSMQYAHRGQLRAMDRDYSNRTFTGIANIVNTSIAFASLTNFLQASNPGSLLFQTNAGGGTFASILPPTTARGATAAAQLYQGAQFGTPDGLFPTIGGTGLVRDPGCNDMTADAEGRNGGLGGYRGFSGTPSPVCYFNTAAYENIVQPQDQYQVYGDANFNVTDSLRYHADANFSKLVIDNVVVDPQLGRFPCEPLPANAPNQTNLATTARQCLVPTNTLLAPIGYFAPGYNPAVVDMVSRFYNATGSARVLTDAQIANITGATIAIPGGAIGAQTLSPIAGPAGQSSNYGRIVLPQDAWRPFQIYNPKEKDGRKHQYVESGSFSTTQQIKGDLGKIFGITVDFDASANYQRAIYYRKDQGILAEHLQRALNGFATNLNDKDGDTCTVAETSGSRTYTAVITGTTQVVTSVVTGVPFTVGAGGGASNYGGTAGNGDAANGFAPTGVGTTGAPIAGNGCYFLNPFSSAIPYNVFTGAQNSVATATKVGYVGGPNSADRPGSFGDYQGYSPGYGLSNDPGIVEWLYAPRWLRQTNDNIALNLTFHGDAGKLVLPGGSIGWAAGGEYRYVYRLNENDLLSTSNINGCTFRRGASGGLKDAINSLPQNTSSTCPGNSAGLWADGYTANQVDRETITGAGFAEVSLPFFDNLGGQVSVRHEEQRLNLSKASKSTVYSGSLKWQVSKALAVRGFAGQTFDPSAIPDDAFTITQSATVLGLTGTGNALNESISFANTGLGPESGFNYSAGIIFAPNRQLQATLDYWNIEVTGRTAGVAAGTIARVLAGKVGQTGVVNYTDPIDCASPTVAGLFSDPQDLTGRPIAGFIDASGVRTFNCIQGTSTLNGQDFNHNGIVDAGEPGLSLAYPTSTNAGTQHTSGIDGNVRYTFPDQILGGTLSVAADATYNLDWTIDPNFVLGVQTTLEEDNLGINRTVISTPINPWRGSLSTTFRKGRHNFYWKTNYIAPFIDIGNAPIQVPPIANGNYNPPANLKSICTSVNLAPIIPDAGVTVNGTLIPAGVGEGAYNANCNYIIESGHKVRGTFQSDFTYRVELPWQSTFSVVVNNVFDAEPPESRLAYGYNSFNGLGPQGRRVRVGVSKKF